MKKKTLYILTIAIMSSINLSSIYANSDDVNIVNNLLDKEKIELELKKDTPFNNFRREILKEYEDKNITVKNDDPNGPTSIAGDELTYYNTQGDFLGTGDVKLTHNLSRVEAKEIVGNVKKGTGYAAGDVMFFQLEEPKVDIKSSSIAFDYKNKKGNLNNVEGKIDRNYIQGKELILDGGEYTLIDGVLTRSSGEKPPYYIKVDKVVVNDEKAVLTNPEFVVMGKVIYRMKEYVVNLKKGNERERREGSSWFPFKLRYSTKKGVTLGYNFDHKLADKVFLYGEFRYATRKDFHNIYGITWENGNSTLKLESGKYEDKNNRWLKKEYSFVYDYQKNLGKSPYTLKIHNEYGLWKEDKIRAHHLEHNFSIMREPIYFDKGKNLSLYPSIGYKILKDNKPDITKKGIYYSATLVNKFSPVTIGYMGYHYTRTDAKNTLFKYGENDFSKEFSLGVGVNITPIDRIIVASEFDASKAMSLQNLDYYWYHDFKFMESQLRYEQKNKKISLHFNFYDF